MDESTLGILKNEAIMGISQDPLPLRATRVIRHESVDAIRRRGAGGDVREGPLRCYMCGA